MTIYHPDLSPQALSQYDLEQFQSLISRADAKILERVAASLPVSVYEHEVKAFMAVFSKAQQSLVMELLLKVLPTLADDSQASILDSLRETVDGYWTDFGDFTAPIASYASSPLLDPLVLPLLRRVFFCADLLTSIKITGHPPPASWLEAIRQHRAQCDFVELSTDLPSAFQQLDALLAAIPISAAPGAQAGNSPLRTAAGLVKALAGKIFKKR